MQAWLAGVVVDEACLADAVVTNDAPEVLPAGCAPGVTTRVTFTATNAAGRTLTCTSDLTVVAAPGAPPAPEGPIAILWPPQHGYVVLGIESIVQVEPARSRLRNKAIEKIESLLEDPRVRGTRIDRKSCNSIAKTECFAPKHRTRRRIPFKGQKRRQIDAATSTRDDADRECH